MSRELPGRPWTVGTDLFVFDNKDYLITVDYISNFWEIEYLADTKSTTVIKELKTHFSYSGFSDLTQPVTIHVPGLLKIQQTVWISAFYLITWLSAKQCQSRISKDIKCQDVKT